MARFSEAGTAISFQAVLHKAFLLLHASVFAAEFVYSCLAAVAYALHPSIAAQLCAALKLLKSPWHHHEQLTQHYNHLHLLLSADAEPLDDDQEDEEGEESWLDEIMGLGYTEFMEDDDSADVVYADYEEGDEEAAEQEEEGVYVVP